MSFTGSEVNRWYEWYPRTSSKVKGGLTIDALARQFNLCPDKCREMFRALGLKKSSATKSPWVLEKNKDDLNALVEQDFMQSTEDLKGDYEKKLREKENKFYRDEYIKNLDRRMRERTLAENMSLYAENVPYKAPSIKKYTHLFDRGFNVNLVSVLSDWHVGARGFKDRMAVGTPYGSDVRSDRLEKLRDEMAKYRSRFRGTVNHIYGFVLGDMIDDPLSATYPRQAVEQDIHGAAQVTEAMRSISAHILFHYQLFGCPMTWYLVRGNHGYEFEEVMYHWLKDHLKNYEDIKIEVVGPRYAIVEDKFSDTQIIGLHGDRGVKAESILNMTACKSKNRLILHGHLHHLKVTEVARGYVVMCPSLMGGNAYSQGFGADSKAGQIMIELHEDGPRPVTYLPVQ